MNPQGDSGSSIGAAVVGSILLTTFLVETQTYGLALIFVITFATIVLITSLLLPPDKKPAGKANAADGPTDKV